MQGKLAKYNESGITQSKRKEIEYIFIDLFP